jgi:hypothetical protein
MYQDLTLDFNALTQELRPISDTEWEGCFFLKCETEGMTGSTVFDNLSQMGHKNSQAFTSKFCILLSMWICLSLALMRRASKNF